MKILKKKIAIVNIFYPPRALGGATRIVVDEVSTLIKQYGDKFEVVVFTADTESSNYNNLTVYAHDGYRVYSITVPLTESSNWSEKNEKIASIFNEFLKFEKPDLVHFHSIQALTGSIVDVTQKLGIPNVVTLHDAWWISDHQFLIDQNGTVYPQGHPDPFEESVLRDGTTLEESMRRKRYLKSLLLKSSAVLAVSETFCNIYKLNGVSNTRTNKNGISNEINWQRKNTTHREKVVCAHIGGMAAHKGFDIFKQAVFSLDQSNIEVLVVDHTKESHYIKQTEWGKTSVTIIGRVDQEHIADLYKRIDVLFAPSTCAESFGLVTREAAACGCWVVGSNIGAIGEDITIENGFNISPDKKSLVSTLKTIDQFPRKYKGFPISKPVRYSADQVNELIFIFDEILCANGHISSDNSN